MKGMMEARVALLLVIAIGSVSSLHICHCQSDETNTTSIEVSDQNNSTDVSNTNSTSETMESSPLEPRRPNATHRFPSPSPEPQTAIVVDEDADKEIGGPEGECECADGSTGRLLPTTHQSMPRSVIRCRKPGNPGLDTEGRDLTSDSGLLLPTSGNPAFILDLTIGIKPNSPNARAALINIDLWRHQWGSILLSALSAITGLPSSFMSISGIQQGPVVVIVSLAHGSLSTADRSTRAIQASFVPQAAASEDCAQQLVQVPQSQDASGDIDRIGNAMGIEAFLLAHGFPNATLKLYRIAAREYDQFMPSEDLHNILAHPQRYRGNSTTHSNSSLSITSGYKPRPGTPIPLPSQAINGTAAEPVDTRCDKPKAPKVINTPLLHRPIRKSKEDPIQGMDSVVSSIAADPAMSLNTRSKPPMLAQEHRDVPYRSELTSLRQQMAELKAEEERLLDQRNRLVSQQEALRSAE